MAQSPGDRTQIVVVLLCVVLYCVHYLVWVWPQPFFIEDSAISFAYARNLVEGEGFVTYAGGERVEGFSNPLWTFLLAAFHLVGISPWVSAKLMGWGFGVATLFFAWGLVRRARPGESDPVSVSAALLLAGSTQFVLWNAGGLENGLFNMLLAGGMWALTREIQDEDRRPLSALLFCGLAMTRPEGMMYAGLGLFGRVLGTLARRQWVALPVWILAFALPFGAWSWWRYEYFAWPFPNTYYAKPPNFKPWGWTSAGWKYIKDWMLQYGGIYAAPLFVVAMTGLSSWRRWVGVAVLVVLAVFLFWDGRSGIPGAAAGEWSRLLSRHWSDARIVFLLGASVVLGVVTLGKQGWEARGLLWGAFIGALFFIVYTGGDWMKGYRFFSQASVPLYTVVALGLVTLVERLPFADVKLKGWLPVHTLYAAPVVIALIYPNVMGTVKFANDPETSPRDVHARVNYMTWVQNRLGLERVTLLDVDMGAHMWWTDWEIVDIAGLVDVPMARHKKFNKKFITDYVFDERKPDFAHVHAAWAKTSKIHLNERFKSDYIEIPGYPSGRKALHVGNHVRKEHLVGTEYRGPSGRMQHFADGVTLEGWDLPSPVVAPGGKLYVDTTWTASPREDGFRVIVFLVNEEGNTASAEVVPGYDWYKPEVWEAGDHVYGRWSVPIPEKLPRGTYDLGFVVLDEKSGAVLAWQPPAPVTEASSEAPVEVVAAPETPPGRFMNGEWRAPGAVRIVSFDDAVKAADERYEQALSQARGGDCEGAGLTFKNARRHVARNERWYDNHLPEIETARVECLVARARGQNELFDQAASLAAARKIDHRNAVLVEMAEPLAQELVAKGDAAREKEDWEGSYRAYAAALSVDPTLSWIRRAAEEVRDRRLNIDPEKADGPEKKTPAKKEGKDGKADTKKKSPVAPVEDDEAVDAQLPEGEEEAPAGE